MRRQNLMKLVTRAALQCTGHIFLTYRGQRPKKEQAKPTLCSTEGGSLPVHVEWSLCKSDKILLVMQADTEIGFFAPFVYVRKYDNPSLGSNMLQLCRAVQEIISISLW